MKINAVPVAWAMLSLIVAAPTPEARASVDDHGPVPRSFTYADLLHRMADMEHVALLPHPQEKTAQWSSYNRQSVYDEETDSYLHWSANNDGFTPQFIREEDGNHVLAEMEGPGVIWRIWSANPQEGHVRIYLDGEEEPAVDLPFESYFDGSAAPFNHPSMTYLVESIDPRKSRNNYVPIPYRESCKIVAEPGWGQYYHFTYSQFPEDTDVPTFTRDVDEESAEALEELADFFENRLGERPGGEREGEQTTRHDVTVGAGETAEVASFDGEGAISALRVTMDFDNLAEEVAALRELALQITWDGGDDPAVWVPLGDFFGTAMGVNEFESLVAGMNDEGFYAYWFMPFADGARIELVNDGPNERQAEFEITRADLGRSVDDYGRFHAKYHRGRRPKQADRWPDWQVLETQGRGRFCGMSLHVWNATGGHNRQYGREGGHWWGEGDEKFFVDGEKFPSTFGTGTEDYFGYAWCDPALFTYAFHGQTLTQNNKGHQSLFRWQIADAIPFQEAFDGYMEKYFSSDWPTRYATVAYWYLDPEGKDEYGPASMHDRLGYFDLNPAHEGENLPVKDVTGGETEVQERVESYMTGESIWSGGQQLWWKDAEPGDKLTLGVPVARQGRYAVRVGMTKASDYAIGRIGFAGETPLAPYDFYSRELLPAEFYLGEFGLDRGEHELVLEVTGAHRQAGDRHLLGVDYVKLEPVEEGPAAVAGP